MSGEEGPSTGRVGCGGVASLGDCLGEDPSEDILRFATLGTTMVKSSCAFVGLLDKAGGGAAFVVFPGVTRGDPATGVMRGEGADLLATSLEGVGRLDSLAVDAWPGLGRWTVRFGEAPMALGVTAGVRLMRSGGLSCSAAARSWPRTEYGPAVAGRAASSGRLRGRIGATCNPLEAGACVASGRVRTAGVDDADAPETVDEFDTVRCGEKCAMADPGRGGRFLPAMAAFFCASIVSRRLGLGGPMVLFDKPRPGRVVPSAFLGELGLCGSFLSSF